MFGGAQYILGGQDFCFYYMLKTNFLGATKYGEAQKKFGGHCPRMPPVATGLNSLPPDPDFFHRAALRLPN